MLTTRAKSVLAIMFVLMIAAVFKLYPTNYESLFTPVNRFVDVILWGCLGISFACLFNKTRLPGKKELSNISYLHLIFTLGIAMGFFSYIISPEVISKDAGSGNPYERLIHWFGPTQWSIYTTFLLIEIYDCTKGLPKILHVIKSYLYAITMMIAIGISLLCGCRTISKILNQMFCININPYYLVTPIGTLSVISAILGIKKGMRIMSHIAMTLMYILTATIVIMTISWNFIPYSRELIVNSYSHFIEWNWYSGSEFDIKQGYPFWMWLFTWIGIMCPFIRKISSGRTLRSVVLAAVFGPTIICTLVITLMSYAFTHNSFNSSYGLITSNSIISILYLLMLIFMFVTSADSTVYSFDTEVSEGNHKNIAYRKILWTTVMCIFVTVLMICGSGSIDALFGISYLTAPILLVVGLICLGYIGYKNWRIK